MRNTQAKIYTVSQINSLVKVVLKESLPPRLIVRGEISDWKHHTSGHCYFSLKDKSGILPCVMWASEFRNVKFSPEDGMAVLATGHIDVYTVGGKYQLYVDKLEPEGVGALQLAFEQMYKRLKAEGLFEEKYKKRLPRYPMRIGILTSESGAAVHDIKDSIHNRWSCAELFLYPVPVQGEGAAEKIAAALKDVNKRNKELRLDILIVGRGGGALEDLWAFNEEVLVRAIFDSKIPVISAVGHEIDTTLADLVADARASTPTKAGVAAVPDMREIMGQLANVKSRLEENLTAKLKLAWQSLETVLASAVFKNPLLAVHNREQQLDELGLKLMDSVKGLLVEARGRLRASYEQIVKIEPHRLLGKKMVDLNNLKNQAHTAMQTIINKCKMRLIAQKNLLEGLNPKSVLQRGYSIATNKKTGLLIRSLDDIQVGDFLITELANENLIESKVTKK